MHLAGHKLLKRIFINERSYQTLIMAVIAYMIMAILITISEDNLYLIFGTTCIGILIGIHCIAIMLVILSMERGETLDG